MAGRRGLTQCQRCQHADTTGASSVRTAVLPFALALPLLLQLPRLRVVERRRQSFSCTCGALCWPAGGRGCAPPAPDCPGTMTRCSRACTGSSGAAAARRWHRRSAEMPAIRLRTGESSDDCDREKRNGSGTCSTIWRPLPVQLSVGSENGMPACLSGTRGPIILGHGLPTARAPLCAARRSSGRFAQQLLRSRSICPCSHLSSGQFLLRHRDHTPLGRLSVGPPRSPPAAGPPAASRGLRREQQDEHQNGGWK
jgi:hypothetical protein